MKRPAVARLGGGGAEARTRGMIACVDARTRRPSERFKGSKAAGDEGQGGQNEGRALDRASLKRRGPVC